MYLIISVLLWRVTSMKRTDNQELVKLALSRH
jgi:hypothetical protein